MSTQKETLVWVDMERGSRTSDCSYFVEIVFGKWGHWLPGQCRYEDLHPTREAAKAACQEHHDTLHHDQQ